MVTGAAALVVVGLEELEEHAADNPATAMSAATPKDLVTFIVPPNGNPSLLRN